MSSADFVVITGLSGSGKSLVHNCFEDMGYYCVDNLPISLMVKFCELIEQGSGEINRAAMVVDVREKSFFSDFTRAYEELSSRFRVTLVFLTASENILLRRFSETRRPHPLAARMPLAEALRLEREKLEDVRRMADHIIDTSDFNVHQVRDFVRNRFGSQGDASSLVVSIVSFGYKHGLPPEADLVFDVRFLANPYFISELRPRTGLDEQVRDYVLQSPDADQLLLHLTGFVRFLLPRYQLEGKSYLTIAIGCTGGRHRSVAISDALAQSLSDLAQPINVTHRDLER